MAADEGLAYILSVVVDAEEVQPALTSVQSAVERTATASQAALEKLSGVNPFLGIVAGAGAAEASVAGVTSAVERASAQLRLLAEQQSMVQSRGLILPTGAGAAGSVEATLAGVERQRQALDEVNRLEQEIQARTQARVAYAPPPMPVGVGAMSQTELEARAAQLKGGLATYNEASLFAPAGVRVTGVQVGDQRMSTQALLDENSRVQNEIRARQRATEDSTSAAAPIGEKERGEIDAAMKAAVGVAVDIQHDVIAIEEAIRAGAAKFGPGGSRLYVREPIPNAQGQMIEPGIYGMTGKTAGGAVSEMDYMRLTNDGSKGAQFMAGGGGGGGGFWGGVGYGFTHGFGGGGEGGLLANAGSQIGMVAQYTLYYQAFRLIEESIKTSVEETINFERAVTDLSNRLDISRESAHGLATEMGLVGAQAGLNPVEAVQLGAGFAGVFAGQAPVQDLALSGAGYAAQLQVLTGEAKTALPEATATVRSFNLSWDDTGRVLDAATSAAQNFGLANAAAVLPGLSTIGDLAKEAGFSVEETANAIADIQSRTGDTSASVAGQLQRFLGREGNTAFQGVFANLGINTNQPFKQEMSELSKQFDSLSDSQRAFIEAQFGGGRAGVAALAWIEDYNKIIQATKKSLEEGGIAQKQYFERLNDVRGLVTSLKSEFEELAKDVGESGAFSIFGVGLIAAKDLLQVVDEIVRGVSKIASFGGNTVGKGFRDVAVTGLEIYGASRIIRGIRGGATGDAAGGGFGRTSATGTAATRTAGALDRLTVAATRSAEALTGDAEAASVDAAAQLRTAAATLPLQARGLFGLLQRQAPNALGMESGALAMGLGVGGAGLLGAALSPYGIIGGAIIAQQLYSGGSTLFDATHAAQRGQAEAFTAGTDPEDMQNEAQRLRRQAAGAEAASQTITGRILGFTSRIDSAFNFLPGPLSDVDTRSAGDVAHTNRAYANLLSYQADKATSAQQTALNSGDYSSQIDLTKQGGVTDSLKNLATLGLDASQQFDALNERLRDFAAASTSAANHLERGAAVLVSQNFANAATTNLFANLSQPGRSYNRDEVNLGGNGPGQGVARYGTGLNDAIDGAISGYLTPLEGTSITPKQGQHAESLAISAMSRYLKSQGWSPEGIKNVLPDLHLAAGSAVQETIAQMNASHGIPISQSAIGGVIEGLPNLISGTTSEVSNLAALGKAAAPQGTQVAGLNAALHKAEETYSSLKASGAKKGQLQPVVDQLNALKAQVQAAVVANLEQQQALADASIPSENTTQVINQHIADLHAILAVDQNPDDRLKFRTDLLRSRQQRASSSEQDAESAIGVGTDPRDSVQQAADAAVTAQMLVDSYRARGVHGKALNEAIKQRDATRQSLLDTELANSQAQTLAAVRAGDPVSAAHAQLVNAKAALDHDLVGSTQYFNDLAAVQNAEAALAQTLAARAQQTYLLAHDTTDPVAQAEANLRAANKQLQTDLANNTGDIGADRLNRRNAREAAQKAHFDQRLSDEQTAYGLQEIGTASYLRFLENQDRVLRRQLDGMKKGSEGYRQRLDELHQIDQAILSTNQQNQGMWNLGDIKVPTPYEARRYIKSTNAGLNYNSAPVTNNSYAIHVNGADTAKVEKILHRLLGPDAFGSRSTRPRKA